MFRVGIVYFSSDVCLYKYIKDYIDYSLNLYIPKIKALVHFCFTIGNKDNFSGFGLELKFLTIVNIIHCNYLNKDLHSHSPLLKVGSKSIRPGLGTCDR